MNNLRRPAHLEWPIFSWIRLFLRFGGHATLLIIYLNVIETHEYKIAVQSFVPILATYLTTAGLLYNRARALPSGKHKTRSLYAAERSTQAFVFSVLGILISAIVFAIGVSLGIAEFRTMRITSWWILVYIAPLTFIQYGYASYALSLGTVSKDFLHPLTPREIAKRIRKAP